MEKLDLTTIINRVRELSTSTPISYQGHDGQTAEFDASIIAATIVGAAIGCHCPIPPRFVPTATSYFASTFGQEIQGTLSKINEAVNIRTQVAYDAACTIWLDRYAMVHKPCDLDTLMMRLATTTAHGSVSANFPSMLLGCLNDEQKQTLDKLVRSVNLSCSHSDISSNIFQE